MAEKEDVAFVGFLLFTFWTLSTYGTMMEVAGEEIEDVDFRVVYADDDDEAHGPEESGEAWVWMSDHHCWARSRDPTSHDKTSTGEQELFPKIFCTGRYRKNGDQLTNPKYEYIKREVVDSGYYGKMIDYYNSVDRGINHLVLGFYMTIVTYGTLISFALILFACGVLIVDIRKKQD